MGKGVSLLLLQCVREISAQRQTVKMKRGKYSASIGPTFKRKAHQQLDIGTRTTAASAAAAAAIHQRSTLAGQLMYSTIDSRKAFVSGI